MPGTDRAYGSMRCLVLTQHMALPGRGHLLPPYRLVDVPRRICIAMLASIAVGRSYLHSVAGTERGVEEWYSVYGWY